MNLLYKKYILIVSSTALFISSCATTTQTPSATATTMANTKVPPTSTPIPASPTPKTGDANQLAPDLAYPILLEQVKQSDPNFDFTNLRWTFVKTTSYDPYSNAESDLINSMYDAFNSNDYEQATQLANQILEDNYLLPDPHFVLLQIYEKSGDQKNADFHSYFLKGLIASISKLGNGRTPESAFIIIQFEEEYFLLDILGIQNGQQSFQEINGIPYDIFEGVDENTNETITLYFDITIPYQWLNKSAPQGPQVP